MILEASDVSGADETLRVLVEYEDGYVERASSSREHASLALRVPADRLAAFRRAVRRIAGVTSESEAVEDVGDQRVDLEARLSSARREEERLLTLMSDRTATIADVIAVEERLASVRERVEQLDAQRAALEQRIEYARVEVEITHAHVAFWEQPWSTLTSAASWGLTAVRAAAVGSLAVMVALGPTLLMIILALAGLVGGLRAFVRRRRSLTT
jgi:hypothetical protein